MRWVCLGCSFKGARWISLAEVEPRITGASVVSNEYITRDISTCIGQAKIEANMKPIQAVALLRRRRPSRIMPPLTSSMA